MSQIHQHENPLKKQAQKYFILSIGFWVPTIIYIIAFVGQGFHFVGLFHLVPFLFGGVGLLFWRKYSALNSGVKGEEQTARALEGLPSEYEVFRSVRLTTSEGTAEYDHIVVGNNGIFVVEVKNHNGTIEGNEEDRSWTQHKVGRKGGEYSNSMGNPVKQVRRQVYILSNYLKENKVKVWVEGAVYFSNPKVRVDVYTQKTPVFSTSHELERYLRSYQPKRQIRTEDLEKARKLLR